MACTVRLFRQLCRSYDALPLPARRGTGPQVHSPLLITLAVDQTASKRIEETLAH